LWNDPASSKADLSLVDVNLVIRQTFVHDIVIEKEHGWSAVIHDHAGCIYVLIVRGSPNDVWKKTKVKPKGGSIRQPQTIRSWVVNKFVEAVIATHRGMKDGLSERQRRLIADDINANPARMRRLLEADKRAEIID
jgi:hypothetical protein